MGTKSEVRLIFACLLTAFLLSNHAFADEAGKSGFQATGWFHLTKAGSRDVLVTPEGKPFVCIGINHIPRIAQREALAALWQGKYRSNWQLLREDLLEQMEDWGFNTIGYTAPKELYEGLPSLTAVLFLPPFPCVIVPKLHLQHRVASKIHELEKSGRKFLQCKFRLSCRGAPVCAPRSFEAVTINYYS